MPASCVRWWLLGAAWLVIANQLRAEAIPLAADHGHCECVVATPHASDQFYLVIGSLGEAAHLTHVSVKVDRADGPEALPIATKELDLTWKCRVEAQAHLLERQRRQRPALDAFPSLAVPPAFKTFHLFTGDYDLDKPANYQPISSALHGVGRHGQVYLDKNDRSLPGIDETIAEILHVFDEDIYPWAQEHLGRALDVDRDGRFTIFLSSRLGTLQQGKVKVDGFVRGSDFFRDLPAPFSNHCDMLYLNAALIPGPQLRAVLAHEFTHAVTFCEHALTHYEGGPTHQDEESWLNEGLSHLVEYLQQRGWSNLDYRVSAYLASPDRYPLIVPDYFAAGLWRNPGTRGAAFLFLRSCLAHSNEALPRRLIQSPLRGISNLEAGTQKPFAELFRQAAVDLLEPQNYGYLDADAKGPLLCGPRFQEVALDHGQAECTLTGTAAAFFLLHSPAGAFASLSVESTNPIQVTLVRVPADLPRLSLRWAGSADKLHVEVTAHHGAVALRGACWEPGSGTDAPQSIRLDRDRLEAGASCSSGPLTIRYADSAQELHVKVLGEDAAGRPVAAWLTWPQPPILPK